MLSKGTTQARKSMKKWNHHKNHLKKAMKEKERKKENYNFINRWIKGDMAHGMHLSYI